MNRILAKSQLGPEVFQLEIEAPRIQKRWKAGQFLIIRPLDTSERIPLHGSATSSGARSRSPRPGPGPVEPSVSAAVRRHLPGGPRCARRTSGRSP